MLVGGNFLFTTGFRAPILQSTNIRRLGSSKDSKHQLSVSVSDSATDRPTNTPLAFMQTPELFSVAPMMGHTNRHFHYYFRHISQYATLYTEMIPSAQMVAAFERIESRCSFATQQQQQSRLITVESVLDTILAARERNEETHLDHLVGMAAPNPATLLPGGQEQPIILQLGGRDPETLAVATAMGVAYGYHGINLNCGCPSNAVSGGDRSGGAALMREASLVAECVEAMSCAIDTAWDILRQSQTMVTTTQQQQQKPILSVKHRLGVHDAKHYNGQADRERDDQEAFLQCRDFVRAITLGGDVPKIQLHNRLGLLGDFEDSRENIMSAISDNQKSTSLWVPGAELNANLAFESSKKVDHKRVQYRAKQRARKATIRNRSIPPLRPNVANLIALEFPHLEVITNGGIQSLEDVHHRVPRGSSVIGAMVGRAAINHPCAFGKADELWNMDSVIPKPTREAVLLDFINYCQREEDAFAASALHRDREPESVLGSLMSLRRRLVAVPFQLFAGEVGNKEYQRRIRKLVARADRHKSSAILKAALSVIPTESIFKPVNQHATEVQEIKIFEASYQRSGPLQRTIF